ncbi:hypothetical protein F2Q68_00017049 [Brassica cretica]|uniref:Uncharacterized protein n=1 Tax=Brassica cretica TaxID=69181 RepID=A0A8S9HKM9_BRACR|nr:hypothetical protein F2Q68_00017049 [Brassica cretica]
MHRKIVLICRSPRELCRTLALWIWSSVTDLVDGGLPRCQDEAARRLAVVSVSLSPWCLGFGPGLNPFQEVPRRSSTSRRVAVVSSLAVSDAGFLDGT